MKINQYANLKRPISMGSFPANQSGTWKTASLIRSGDLNKSHQSLLYNGPNETYAIIEAQ